MQKTLIVLDVDGTITKDFREHGTFVRTDRRIHDANGNAATQFLRRYFIEVMAKRGMDDHDHRAWWEMTLQAWRESGLNLSHLKEEFASNAEHLRPGFADFLHWLKAGRSEEVKIIINSYGASQIIELMLEAEGLSDLIDVVYGIPLTFTADGTLDGYEERRLITAEIKGTITSLAMQTWGISADRTIGIGDSSGDRFIAPMHRLLFATDDSQVIKYSRHFTGHVISEGWSGVQEWLQHNFSL